MPVERVWDGKDDAQGRRVVPQRVALPFQVIEAIDFWAVDWDDQDDAFHNEWQTYRTRKDPTLRLVSDPVYGPAGGGRPHTGQGHRHCRQ